MKTFNNHTLSAFILTALLAALHAAPANAMGGRSGAQALMAESRTHATECQSQMENGMQAQIDSLRKEVAELKAQQALAKGPATAQ